MSAKARSNTAPSPSTKEDATSPGLQPQDGQWQNYVLGRLQEKLAPEPIKVACMRPPVNRKLTIEEYHGKLSKEDVSRLLDGKSGRYLVRDSSTPGSYTLSFNFDGEIKHQKLICHGDQYKTDVADSAEYKTVHELMVYVLGIGKQVKKMEGAGKKKEYQKMHEFENHTYVHPKWCDVCRGFIWGLWSQGLKCEDCGVGIHKHCRQYANDPCKKVVIGQKLSSVSQSPAAEVRKKVSLPDVKGDSSKGKFLQKPQSNILCVYEKECFKFLTSQVPLSYFDRSSPLNDCYCDEHPYVKMKEALHNWCKFALVRSPKELQKNFKMAYFSVFPSKIKETLDALASGAFYQRLKSDELVVLPSLESIILMETHEMDDNPVRTVLQVGVEAGSYTVKIAVNEPVKGKSKQNRLEYWAILPGNHVISMALLIKLKKN